MFRHFLVAIVLSIAMIGCSDRVGGPIFPVPALPVEQPSVPTNKQVLADLNASHGDQLSSEIVSRVHDIESHTYIVVIESENAAPQVFRVTYFLLDGEWKCVPELIEQ